MALRCPRQLMTKKLSFKNTLMSDCYTTDVEKSEEAEFSFDEFYSSPTDEDDTNEENCPLIKVSKEEVME